MNMLFVEPLFINTTRLLFKGSKYNGAILKLFGWTRKWKRYLMH